MRDQHISERISRQVLFQPVAGLQVEVVGGLVQQQHVGLSQQQFGQGNAHLPAAGKLFRPPRPVLFPKAQAVQHRADLGLNGVPSRARNSLSMRWNRSATADILRLRDQFRPSDA